MGMLKRSGRDSIQAPPEDKSEALTLEDRSALYPVRGPHIVRTVTNGHFVSGKRSYSNLDYSFAQNQQDEKNVKAQTFFYNQWRYNEKTQIGEYIYL
jgi:hypothetical protein